MGDKKIYTLIEIQYDIKLSIKVDIDLTLLELLMYHGQGPGQLHVKVTAVIRRELLKYWVA